MKKLQIPNETEIPSPATGSNLQPVFLSSSASDPWLHMPSPTLQNQSYP